MDLHQNLIWIDLERTGLNPDVERIIEIATIVTDTNLNILAEGPVFAIHQDEGLINNMDKWNTNQHHKSGLIERVNKSTITEKQAEQATIEFLSNWVAHGASPMCGNTIGQDRRFLCKYMPELERYFHYRNLDVTTIKILAQRWAPNIAQAHTKDSQHLALQDIKDSIEELIFYRDNFINCSINP